MEEPRAAEVAENPIQHIVIFGTGPIGAGFALTCALNKVTVALISKSPSELSEAREWITDFFDRGVEKGAFKAAEVYQISAKLCFALGLDHVGRADLILDCLNEDFESKRALMAEVGPLAKPNAICATHTSLIPVRELGEAFGKPDRFIGVHFFTPVAVNKLVEVVSTPDTSRETIEEVMDFCIRIGKTPVLTKDQPGYVVNRLLVPFLLNAMKLYQEGNAPEDVDTAIELALGHKVGPLRLADSIGLDVVARMAERLYEYYGDDMYDPPEVLKQHIERGRLGKKTGRGFYRY
ncbi:MAG: 3-hydroxybutyryl-CoA dehydrogenase [Planctomycetota bacterium]